MTSLVARLSLVIVSGGFRRLLTPAKESEKDLFWGVSIRKMSFYSPTHMFTDPVVLHPY